MKYVGHLDMVRYFQKAMRRAGIDISYTAGFSPHQIMSFAQPLGVGLYSEGEYIDIETAGGLTSREAVDALNAVMADGVRILSYRKLRRLSGTVFPSSGCGPRGTVLSRYGAHRSREKKQTRRDHRKYPSHGLRLGAAG